jgi:hypothetical protein
MGEILSSALLEIAITQKALLNNLLHLSGLNNLRSKMASFEEFNVWTRTEIVLKMTITYPQISTG